MKGIIKFNINQLIKLKLSLEEYLILYCVDNRLSSLLEQYVLNIGQIDSKKFNNLIDKGYLFPINEDITFSKLKLTSEYYSKFKDKLDYDKLFDELKEVYPKAVKSSNGKRRSLQTDFEGCKKKYKEAVNSLEEHNLILNCVRLYVKEKKDANELQYLQLLSTFINQKGWETYIEEAQTMSSKDINTTIDEYREDRL